MNRRDLELNFLFFRLDFENIRIPPRITPLNASYIVRYLLCELESFVFQFSVFSRDNEINLDFSELSIIVYILYHSLSFSLPSVCSHIHINSLYTHYLVKYLDSCLRLF